MNGDITYCVAECKNKKKCRHNPDNRPYKDMDYWVTDYSGRCEEYEPKGENHA